MLAFWYQCFYFAVALCLLFVFCHFTFKHFISHMSTLCHVLCYATLTYSVVLHTASCNMLFKVLTHKSHNAIQHAIMKCNITYCYKTP